MMEEVWHEVDNTYKPSMWEWYIRVERNGVEKFYVKEESVKINYYHTDFVNFLNYNLNKLKKGTIITYLIYHEPLKQVVHRQIKITH